MFKVFMEKNYGNSITQNMCVITPQEIFYDSIHTITDKVLTYTSETWTLTKRERKSN